MSKLFERLDELEKAAQSSTEDYDDDERCDTEKNFRFVYAVAAAYPKLRAVAEAAAAWYVAWDSDNGFRVEREALRDALAALEGEE